MPVADYAKMRCCRVKRLERCGECGRTAKTLRVPITRGENAGRVRVQWTHQELRTDLGGFVRVENQVSCWGWE